MKSKTGVGWRRAGGVDADEEVVGARGGDRVQRVPGQQGVLGVQGVPGQQWWVVRILNFGSKYLWC